MARRYRKENGRLDEGFYDELDAYSRENPLFDDLQPASPSAAGLPPKEQLKVGTWYNGPNGRGLWTGEGFLMEEEVMQGQGGQ